MDIHKISATALALALTASLASCSETKRSSDTDSINSENASEAEALSENAFENAFRAVDYEIPIEYTYLNIRDVLSESEEYVVNVIKYEEGGEESVNKLYRTDKAFTRFDELDIPLPDEAAAADAGYAMNFFNPDGSMLSIITLEDHGGVKFPEGEYDENFDYDSYYDNCETSYMLAVYDKELALVSSTKLEYPESFFDQWDNILMCVYAADGNSLLCSCENGEIWRISSDGKFIQLTDIDEDDSMRNINSMVTFFRDRDGSLIASVPQLITSKDPDGYEYDTIMYEYCDIDDRGKLSEPFYSYTPSFSFQSYSPSAGYDEYRILLPNDDSLIGITDSGEEKEIINWNDSDTEAMNVVSLGDDEFIGFSTNRSSEWGETVLKKLVRRDPSEFANIKVITIGCNSEKTSIPRELVNSFNSLQTEYRLKIKNIEDTENSVNALGMSLITGDAPDMIYSIAPEDFFNLRNKGAFAELYGFMDEDADCSRDAFMPNILSAMESDSGKLFGLPLSFGINTIVTRKDVSDIENWKFDDMLALYDAQPLSSDMLYAYDTKEEMLNYMLRPMSGLIDYESGKCNFDSPDFVKMLEFCNRFVSETDIPDKESDGEAHQMWYSNKYFRLKNNETLIELLSLCSPNSYSCTKNLQGGGAELTLAGFPSDDGKGGRLAPGRIICINEKAKDKQGAWEALKYFMSRVDNSTYDPDYGGFPSMKEGFEAYFKKDQSDTHTYNGNLAPPLNADEEKMIREYILSCDTLGTSMDNEMYNICLEEAECYFNGEVSAKTSAERIQNRIQIFVSEQS